MMDDFTKIYEMYTALKSEREQYKSNWDAISRYVGIGVDPDYQHLRDDKSAQKDLAVEDPTATLNVNQLGDYLSGIMWGTGDKAVELIPSRYVTELAEPEELAEYYAFASDQLLYHVNHSDAGFHSALKAYAYDQAAFGTSGIGAFPNQQFISGIADNALIFRQYGIDNICIDEGSAGNIEYVFATYRWRVSRIIGEFCSDGAGMADNAKIAKLPRIIRKAYESGKLNDEFKIVFGFFPRSDFDPKLKGKRSAKYRGVWFMDGQADNNAIFAEEDFAERPISVARMIKVRGEVYGRSSGTMLLSTIRAMNFMMGTSLDVIEKMANPALGIFSNAIFGDSVLDSSPNGLTVFNGSLSGGQSPTFPIYDVGNPAPLIQIINDYLGEKISTAFKIDALLDFSASSNMSATESLQRYVIRGKSQSGMLMQQETEMLEPLLRRCISLLVAMDQLGANPSTMPNQAAELMRTNRVGRVIPDAVLRVMEQGRPWYEFRYNNELSKMVRTDAIEALVQTLNAVSSVAALYPQIVEAVDWYELVELVNKNSGPNNAVLIGANAFRERIAAQAQAQAAMMQLQAGQMGAQISKDQSAATKNNAEATNAKA